MKKILGHLKDYITETDKRIFVLCSLFISILIFINYYFGLNRRLSVLPEAQQYTGWFLLFLITFAFPYILQLLWKGAYQLKHPRFVAILLLGPAIFAWKISSNLHFSFTANENLNAYWNAVTYWPFKLLVITGILFITWKLVDADQPFYGLYAKGFDTRPYLLMLLIMVPLVAAASTQKDFLAVYPKLKHISFLQEENRGWYQLLYELSYGSDFFSIELFFRGFLVLAFARWVGKDAILPMALFYCTIHFGKPLGECISSYFGGILLGVVTFHTRSIYGGLIVHLGIAWLMEIGGYLGIYFLYN